MQCNAVLGAICQPCSNVNCDPGQRRLGFCSGIDNKFTCKTCSEDEYCPGCGRRLTEELHRAARASGALDPFVAACQHCGREADLEIEAPNMECSVLLASVLL